MRPKRTIPLLIILFAFLLCTTVRADYIYGGLRYTEWDGSITITAYYGNEETVTVPAMIDGLPVNYIAAGVFSENDSVKAIILPDCIMGVEAGAFSPEQTVAYSAGSPAIPVEESAFSPEPEPVSGASAQGETVLGGTGGNDPSAGANGTDYFEQAGGIGESGYEDDDDIPMPSAAAASALPELSAGSSDEADSATAGTPAETEAPQTASTGTEDEGSSAVPETALTPAGSPEDDAGQEAEEQKADRAFSAWQYLLIAAGAVALAVFIAAAAKKKKQ